MPAAAEANGLHWVSYDRPGYGGSSPHDGRTVASAAADVAAIADALGIGQRRDQTPNRQICGLRVAAPRIRLGTNNRQEFCGPAIRSRFATAAGRDPCASIRYLHRAVGGSRVARLPDWQALDVRAGRTATGR